MKKMRPLMHTKKRPVINIIGSFDIETTSFNDEFENTPEEIEFLDAFLKFEDEDFYHRAKNKTDLMRILLERENVIIYAHNGGRFDFNFLLEDLYQINIDRKLKGEELLKIETIVQGESNVIQIKIGTVELRDSLALIPMSLKEACKAFKTPTQKGDIGLKDGEKYDANNLEHQFYCQADCQATIEVVKAVMDMVWKYFECGIGLSTASTALNCFRSKMPKGKKYWRMARALEEFCRKGYYGGFVYPGKTMQVHGPTLSADRNASFGASMIDHGGMPVGNPSISDEISADKPGIFRVWVKAEKPDLPIVPYRGKLGLMWPVGSFRTYLTNEEILFARDHGYEIEVELGYVWPKYEQVFQEIVAFCEEQEYTNPEIKPLIKLIRNGLYGKFGTRFINRELRWEEPDDPEEWTPLTDGRGHVNPFIWTREKENEAEYIMPHWAAFITARARMWMMKTMLAVGIENCFYGDTDSVKADQEAVLEAIRAGKIEIGMTEKDIRECPDFIMRAIREAGIDISPRYGTAKVDEVYSEFQAMGPKVYHGVLAGSDKTKTRAKGIPMRLLTREFYQESFAIIMEECYNDKERHKRLPEIKIHSTNKTMARMKDGTKGISRGIKRRLTDFLSSSTWDVQPDGSIFQPRIEE